MCKLRYWGMPSPCSSLFFSTMTWYKNAIMDFSALRHLLLQWVLIVTMVTVDMSQPCSSLFTVPLENSFIVVCALQQLLAKTCVFLCRSLCSRFFFFLKAAQMCDNVSVLLFMWIPLSAVGWVHRATFTRRKHTQMDRNKSISVECKDGIK